MLGTLAADGEPGSGNGGQPNAADREAFVTMALHLQSRGAVRVSEGCFSVEFAPPDTSTSEPAVQKVGREPMGDDDWAELEELRGMKRRIEELGG